MHSVDTTNGLKVENGGVCRHNMRVHEFHPEIWAKAYGLICETNQEIILIDPVYDYIQTYLDFISQHGYSMRSVIATHTHADHITACFSLSASFHCDYIMHETTASLGVTTYVNESSVIEFAGVNIHFHHVPGHTNDSMIIDTGSHIFTGDFLFTGSAGVGRDDLPSGRMKQHWESLSKITKLDGQSVMYTGHEPPHTKMQTLEWSREHNPVLKMSSYEDYEAWQLACIEQLGSVSKIKIALPANLFGEVPEVIPCLN